MEISCIVLAGGKSLRLGRNKVLETVGSRSLLHQVTACVSPFCQEIIIATAEGQAVPQFTNRPEIKTVTDIIPQKGPLGGIYTGLVTSRCFYNLVVACDMPFLNRALLGYMQQLAANFDLTVPRVDNKVEPLHAIYAKSCLTAIEGMIKQNNLSVYRLPELVKVRYVESEEIDRFDPEHLSFFNINTKADLEKARELARGMVADDQR